MPSGTAARIAHCPRAMGLLSTPPRSYLQEPPAFVNGRAQAVAYVGASAALPRPATADTRARLSDPQSYYLQKGGQEGRASRARGRTALRVSLQLRSADRRAGPPPRAGRVRVCAWSRQRKPAGGWLGLVGCNQSSVPVVFDHFWFLFVFS